MIVTQGAYFMASVCYEAYQKTSEANNIHIRKWESLSSEEKRILAEGFQTLINLEVIDPISYNGFRILRKAGFRATLTSKEKLKS